MNWNYFNTEIGDMLSRENFAYVPKKKVYTKKIGKETAVVDISAENIYFFGGDEGNYYNDPNEILAGIRLKIDSIVGQSTVQKGSNTSESPGLTGNDITDHIQTLESQQSEQSLTQPVAARKQIPPPETLELTVELVKKYINEKVTDEEAYTFIQLCKAKHLNPFLGQVHLIKKEFTGSAKTVVGKEAFLERAERHEQYDGFEAGIIVKLKDGTLEDRPGAFYQSDEKLLGGWAKVYRKDQSHPSVARVSMNEYNTGKASWVNIPATMIRKVAFVQSLRESFPSELSGLYDSAEMGVES